MTTYPVFTRNKLAGNETMVGDPYDQQMVRYNEYLKALHQRDQQMPSSGVIMPNSETMDPYQVQDFNNGLLGQDRMKTRRAY